MILWFGRASRGRSGQWGGKPSLQKWMAEVGSEMHIVFLTGYGDSQATVQAMKAGRLGF